MTCSMAIFDEPRGWNGEERGQMHHSGAGGFLQHAQERGIQGSFLDLEQIVGSAADGFGKSIAMHRLAAEGFQDHHFQRSREEVPSCGFIHTYSLYA